MENKFEVNDVIVDRVSKYTYSVLYVNNHEQTYGLLNHTDVYEFTVLWSDVDNFADLRSDVGYSYPLRDEDGEIVTTPMPKINLEKDHIHD